MMKKIRLQLFLMIITILGVACFQVFWLNRSYEREAASLRLKTEFIFRDAIQALQAERLSLAGIAGDSTKFRRVKLVSADSVVDEFSVRLKNAKGVVSSINIVSSSLSDTIEGKAIKKIMLATGPGRIIRKFNDDTGFRVPGLRDPDDHLVRVLYRIDSLQGILKESEIAAAMLPALKKEKIYVPFTVFKMDSTYKAFPAAENEVAVGFSHPRVYRLVLGNAFFYLLKRISLPIIFSVLLLLITILSFLLLYGNLQRQQKLTAIKNDFIANITHELKTPIATVSVAIEAMKNFNALHDPSRTQEYLGIADRELNRLSLLVDKVLRLSMFESTKVQLNMEQFDIAVLCRDIISSMQLQFEKANVSLHTDCKGDDFSVRADRMHLTGVIYNLLDNALKYSRHNPVINVTVQATFKDIFITVADNGIGIDPAYRDKIFDKFFRVPHGNLHDVKGYGLGLSYAAHVMQRHRGSIKADASGTGGTAFTIQLPRNNAG